MAKFEPPLYLDNAATTPLSPAALEVMRPYLQERFGNPSSLYRLGRQAKKAIEEARATIARALGVLPQEIYFTSGGTEADNWALRGIIERTILERGPNFWAPQGGAVLLTSQIEHHAVLRCAQYLERFFNLPVSYLPVDREGRVQPETLQAELGPNATLVSIMTANNELGCLQPIPQLAQRAHQAGAYFHTDAVQAVGHLDLQIPQLGVDLLSASAHKFQGPKGIGFLYLRQGIEIEPLLHGGAQERKLRAGTENVAAIVGMARALEESLRHLQQRNLHLQRLEDELLRLLREKGVPFKLNSHPPKLPGVLNLSFPNCEGETIQQRLNLQGIAVATGSACDSHDFQISHVIKALKLQREYALGAVRIAF